MVSREPLEDSELKQILETVADEPLRDRVIIHSLAHLGFRAGAVAHMTEDWMDYQNHHVTVPSHQVCSAGRDGGPCSECRNRLERIRCGVTEPLADVLARVDSYADPSDESSLFARARRYDRYSRRDGLGVQRLNRILREYDGMWFPKSGSGHRPVPVKDSDTWDILTRWFGAHDSVMVTRQTVGNVVRRVASASGIRRKVEPHEFRHTFGTRLAELGFSVHEIKDAMGHATTAQAEDYIKMSGRRLDDAFTEKWESV